MSVSFTILYAKAGVRAKYIRYTLSTVEPHSGTMKIIFIVLYRDVLIQGLNEHRIKTSVFYSEVSFIWSVPL